MCQYPGRSDILSPDLKSKQAELLLQYEISHINCEANNSASSRCSSAVVGSPISSPGVPSSQSAHNLMSYDRHLNSLLQSQTSQILTPTESTLLNLYLKHTCQDMTVDDDDRYTLQVGIPNLAFQNKLLMNSVLAFSAVCKCCDIINQPSISYGDRERVLVLLSIADQYHMESLREIQATLAETEQYDHILANAAMMGMYGSSSHYIRIWLAETASSSDDLERGRFMPKSCQWISLFRAVRVAYDLPRVRDSCPLAYKCWLAPFSFSHSKICDWAPTEIITRYQVLSSHPLWCLIKGMSQNNGATANIIPFTPHLTFTLALWLFFLALLDSRGGLGFLILKIHTTLWPCTPVSFFRFENGFTLVLYAVAG